MAIWMSHASTVLKAVSLVVSVVAFVLLLIISESYTPHYAASFLIKILIVLTVGFLAGWSITSILDNMFDLKISNVVNMILVTLASIGSLVMLIYVLIKDNESSEHKSYIYEIGMAVAFLIQSIVVVVSLVRGYVDWRA